MGILHDIQLLNYKRMLWKGRRTNMHIEEIIKQTMITCNLKQQDNTKLYDQNKCPESFASVVVLKNMTDEIVVTQSTF